MPRPLSTLDRSIYIHQSNHFPDDPDFSAVCRMVRNAGANLLKLKALDGNQWMSTYDTVTLSGINENGRRVKEQVPAPWSVTGPQRWYDLREIAKSEGIQLIPWVVPHGLDLDLELAELLSLAGAAGDLIELDIEPYAGFWEADMAGLVQLVETLREAGITVWMDIDSRWYASARLPLVDLAGLVDRFLSQDYYTTFERPASEVLTNSADLFASLPARDWGTILPHDGPWDFQACADLAADRDAAEIGLWLLDYSTSTTLEYWQAIT